jgi:murein DD-endopeptidase MepM/ murein hydrolase activator NlpD
LCVPTASGAGEVEGAVAETNAHVDRLGRRVVYEHLPRRPELPEDYDRYVYPTGPGLSGGHYVSSGYDLDRPDALQRRGEALSAVGHGGLDLPEARGAPVRVVALRGEVGDPLVVYVGVLFGTTVVLRHTVREHGRLRVYLSLHGHLDRPAPGLVPGHGLEPGAVLGFVGDSGALGVVHLHYEVRLLRPGVDPTRVEPGRLTDQAVSIPCDPRNVLPLR